MCTTVSFFLLTLFKIIYLFWLCWVFFAAGAFFSSCGEGGLFFVALQGFLIAVASLVVELGV